MSQGNTANREFAYAPRWGVMMVCAGFFGICGFVMQAKAQSNDRGLIINGLIELSASSATIFYWVLAWLSFGCVVGAALLLVVRLIHPQKLVLAQEGLYAPKWVWSRTPTFIAYRDVLTVSSLAVNGQVFLKIVHIGGTHNVAASFLESKAAFGEFCRELTSRLQTRGVPVTR